MHIQVIAPSACVDADAIHQAQQQLSSLDVHVSFAPHLFAQHRYLAGSIQQRVSDLKRACEDPSIDALWCARGGTGAAQLLPYLDHWILNKPLIGYSDSTVLLNYIAQHGGCALHAPVFQEIAVKNNTALMPISADALEILNLLKCTQTPATSSYPIEKQHALQDAGDIQGTILGGNLATLASLQGTAWALQTTQQSILLLEDVGEAYYRLERLFLQVLQSIDCSKLKAIVLGDFHNCPQKNVPHSIPEIFNEYLTPLQIPLFSCSWFGHGHSNRPFWIGKSALLTNHQLHIS